MAITFLDEEEDIVATAEPPNGESRITFLDEEEPVVPAVEPTQEPVATAPVKAPKITFLDEEPQAPSIGGLTVPPAPEAPKPKPIVESVGQFEGIKNAAMNAFDSSRQAMAVAGGVTPEEAEQISKLEYQKEARKLSPAYSEYLQAEGMDAVKAFAKNPFEITTNIITEGLAGSLYSLGAGVAAGGIAAGATAATGVGVPLAPAAFLGGQIGGTFAGSLATEYGGKVLEELQNAGMDIKDPESIQKFFGDEKLMESARSQALKRGVPVAIFDGVSAGIGGRLARLPIQALTKTPTRLAVTEGVAQAALGGGGEIAGAVAAGEEIQPKAVFAEVVGEAGPAAAEITVGRIAERLARTPEQKQFDQNVLATQVATRASQDIAPATADAVERQVQDTLASVEETPEQRVARLQREAQEAAGEIELEEEGAGLPPVEPTPPVTPTPEAAVAPVEPVVTAEEVAQPPTPEAAPTPEIAQAAQTRITEREGQAVTPVKEPTGNRVEAAAYQAPDGTVYYGPSHLDAMGKALDAGKIEQAEIDAKQETTSRETPEFGFATNADPFVSRDQAETIARQSGQITVEQPATGKLHSNEVSLDAFAQPVAPTPTAAPAGTKEAQDLKAAQERARRAQEVVDRIRDLPEDNPEVEAAYTERTASRANLLLAEVAARHPNSKNISKREDEQAFLAPLQDLAPLRPAEEPLTEGKKWRKGEEVGYNESVGKITKAIPPVGQPSILYRVVTREDYERILANGQIDSDMRGAITTAEGINLTPNTATATYYLPRGETGVVLAIDTTGLDLNFIQGDSYIRSFTPIPADRIIGRSDFIHKDAETGSYLLRPQDNTPVANEPESIVNYTKAAPEAAPAAVEPTPVTPPVTPQLEPLRRVARAEQTEEDVAGLVDAGFVEVYNGQPVITQAGLETLPEAERPRLTPEARKIQIDTRTSEAAAEAISKNLRIGVDQVPVDVRMPAGWTLEGDVYVPPTITYSPEATPLPRESAVKGLGLAVATPEVREARTERDPEVQKAAQDLKAGTIDRDEYQRIVDMRMPLRKFEAVPIPATNDDMLRGLGERAIKRKDAAGNDVVIKKTDIIQSPESIAEGTVLEARLDIPAYESENVWVVSLHRPRPDLQKGAAAQVVAYTPTSVLRNVTFGVTEKAAAGIAAGKPKSTIATMRGEYVPMTAEQAYQLANTNKDQWVEIGMNPVRHSYFYDKDTQTPVESAEEVVQVGGMVLAKNPVFGKREDYLYARRVEMGRAGMETSAVEARLQELGFPTGGIIRVVNQPDADFEGRTIILDGKVTGIELNAAAMRDNATIDRVLNHEFAESANADGALNKLVERLTPKEKKEINDTITRLRYEERARTSEEAARAIETLAEAWKGRGFFTRAVARVEAWASKLGFKLTRRAAEYIAARNLADINAGFRTAYNRFINVRGEAREGRAFVTPEENARFLELARNPFLAEANKDELRRLVNKAAKKAKYDTKNLLFHGTTHIFNVFRRDRANSENDFGKGYYFTNTELDAQQNYAGEGPDLTNRIERLSEQIQANEEVSQEVATQRAKEILSGGDRRMISAYIKMDNPFLIGGDNQTFLDLFEQYDEATDEFGEPTGKLVDFINNFKEVAAEYENIDADSVAQKLYEAALGYDGLSASEAIKILKDLTSDANDVNGDLAGNEIIRRTIEASGFDGIVDRLVNQKFGTARRIGGAMAGVGPETVHTIVFNSNQIKSADLITYDDNGNIIPLNERFQPASEDIRFARREVRESRREPEAIPTFTEGTPEAATLKEMEASMAKVDAASEAKGGKPETQKISDIAANWMDQGGDERALQDAIVENTNLTPANAARVAKAIARQYDIQQSIATAFLETQTGLSVEALPEGVTLPKEVDPDRPKPVMQRLFDVFMGVRVPPTKLTVNEKAALKDQIRLKAAANRAAKAAQKETSDQVIEVIKAMDLRGGVRPKQVQALAKRATKVIWTNEKSVETFTDYAAKVVENANYDADLREAKAAQARAKQLSKQKKIAAPQREMLENIAKIPVNRLDDPRMYSDAVNYYLRGFKAVLSPDYVVVPDSEMTSYLSQMESEATRNQRDFDRAVNERLAEKYGVDPDDVNSVLEAVDIIKQIEATENREAMDNLLTEKAIETQDGLKAYDQTPLRPDQRKVVDFMMKVDPKALDAEERQRFIRITNNIIYNNQTNGAEYFVSVAKGQQNARSAAQDSDMIAKNKAWINLLPRLVSEKMQRGWALELQSVADTFRNAFGKGAMAKVYKAIGMLDLNMGFTKANNTIDEIQEKIAEFHRGLEKKYKAAARNQDGLLAEGVAGFLIQKVPNKGETESIVQRRDLIKQDIANRRASREVDRVAMADRIETILNQIDGEGIQAVLKNLKQQYPANHESLVWYKDTLFPQYKEFLKNFDENFNDQANNYNNPDYLPIAFSKASPSLAITPEEEQVFFDQVSLTPKQSAYTIKRLDYTTLPKDRTTKRPKEIEFNLRRNAFDSLSDQINKAYTSGAWQQIASFMKTPEAEAVFGGQANQDFFIERLNRLRLSRMRRGAMSRGNIERAVDSLSVISRKLGTGIALGGVYQWIKQPPDQLVTALGSGGRYDLMAQNIMPKNQKAARELLRKFSIGRRGDASAGYKYINQMEGHQNRLERYFSESKWDQVKEEGGKIADVWMAALKQSDFWAASTAWMTYYEGELNKRDIKIEDWAKEAELVDTDPARQEAAAFAEQMTDIYQGSSDPTQMATFAQSGKSGWENLMKAIFVPFNSFAIQQRMRLYSDARDVLNGEKSGVGGLSGTIGGLLLFHATKRLALPVISGGIATILYGLLGVDMDEPDEEKQKEEANKRWRQMQGEMLGNLLVGGTPQIVEAKFIDAMNYASYLISLQLESENVLNDEGEIMKFDQYAKERSPFWRYRSFDNAMSLGMLDIGLGQAEQAILQTKMVATPEEMEMYTPEEQRLLYFSALSEWLYLMRLNDADFARIVTKARRDMVNAAKEREKELKRIREGR